MAKTSIPVNENSCNSYETIRKNTLLYQDTALLSELLQLSHQYYKNHSVIYEEAFMAFLQGFIEWLEDIFRENKALTLDYYINLLEFHKHLYKNHWKQITLLEPFFNAAAYLIQYGVEIFRMQNYPKSYESFLQQLEMIFDNDAIIQAKKQRTAYLLLEQLRQKPL
jgi:hypothetical protein